MNPGASMSDPGEIVMTVLLGVSTIGMAIVAPFVGTFRHTRPRAGVFAGSALIVMGTMGWFGSSLSAVGGLNWLPRSWEWPVGTAKSARWSGCAIGRVEWQGGRTRA
jgi:hypothetical protein